MHEFYEPELRCRQMETYGESSDRLPDIVICGNDGSWQWSVFLWTAAAAYIYEQRRGYKVRNGDSAVDLFPGALRGMGHSGVPMLLSIIGTVGTRIVWIYWIFPRHRSLAVLFISYPASWIITLAMQIVCYFYVRNMLYKKIANKK